MNGCNVIMNMRLPLQLQKGIYDFIHILQMLKVNIKVKGVILRTIIQYLQYLQYLHPREVGGQIAHVNCGQRSALYTLHRSSESEGLVVYLLELENFTITEKAPSWHFHIEDTYYDTMRNRH